MSRRTAIALFFVLAVIIGGIDRVVVEKAEASVAVAIVFGLTVIPVLYARYVLGLGQFDRIAWAWAAVAICTSALVSLLVTP